MTNPARLACIGACAAVASVCVLLVIAIPAQAADPIYPTGSRVGLVPPEGMRPSKKFPGFEDPDHEASILLTTLPAAAYDDMEKTAIPEVLKKGGITIEKREPLQLSAGKGFLITGTQVADKMRYRKWVLIAAIDDVTALVSVEVPEPASAYPDNVVRAALATVAVRATVPDAERLSLLPFTVGDLAGFQIEDVIPGRALLLIDPSDKGSSKDVRGHALDARLIIAALAGGPAEPNERPNFARLSFNSIAGISNVQITMSEPLRIGGQQGYQTVAQAKDVSTGTDIMVVQWLRFGGGGFLQITGISRADLWSGELERLRTVRDSIELK